ncbi:MAG: hypothetical protein Q4C91_05010 [Eubacteriales bacterium]|nr:hypothetical protein [Eubacteriales bacterium]
MKRKFIMSCLKLTVLERIIVGSILAALCILADSIDLVPLLFRDNISVDVHYFWFNSITYGGIYGKYFINILAALPFSCDFCEEYSNGIWRYVLGRMKISEYIRAKFISCFLISGFTVAAGGGLFILMAGLKSPLLLESRQIEIQFLPYSEQLINKSALYFVLMLYLLFLSGGLWACIAYTLSVYFPFKYFVYISPFIGIFLLARGFNIFHIPGNLRLDYWLCGREVPIEGKRGILIITSVVLSICIMCSLLCIKKLKWRIQHE